MSCIRRFVIAAAFMAALPALSVAQAPNPHPTSSATTDVTAKTTLTLEGARRVLDAAIVEARVDGKGGVIAVVDDGGNLIALERLDGTFAAGANVSIGKARTAALFKRPTAVFETLIHDGRFAMAALDDFTPLQGGLPIVVDGQVVGAVGVSGAASQVRDEEIALAGAAALQGHQTASVR